MKGMLMSLGLFGCLMALSVLCVEAASYLFLSQVEIPAIEGATSLTSVGFAIWYGWYVTTRAIPKIVDQHQSQVDKIEASRERQINALTTTFREEMHANRQAFRCERGE